MRPPALRTFSALAVAALLAVGVAACGSSNSSSSTSTSTASSSTASTPAATPAAAKLKVGMVTDIGGLNDRSFNASAYKGLQEAKSQLGVDIRVLTSKSDADYVPNLSTLARQKYDVVIAVGFLMADATAKVAKAFPNTKFAIIDFSQAGLKGKPANVEGLLFKEQESGYLAGYLSGLYMKDKGGKQVASTVGGQKIPPVDHYIAGFIAGLKASDPAAKELNAYSQDFVAPDKCKEIALNQIGEGSQVVFQVAGQCGLGALDAAKEKGVEGIGVDADQAYLGPHILTSALKKIDQAVLTTVKEAQAGQFKAGTDTTFDVAHDGTGIGKTNAAGAKYASQLAAVTKKIAAGSIDIPDTVPGK